MRKKVRRFMVYMAILLFPVTMNYFSPYVSIDGAMNGIISGSVIMFLLMFLSGIFLGRIICGWICPAAGIGEMAISINSKPVNAKKLAIIRYLVFAVWFGVLVAGFIMAGGIKGINPLHLTDSGISIDEPGRYIMYYMIVAIFFGLNLLIGRRGTCHTICWMSPFMVGGYLVGRCLHIPQLRIKAESSKCSDCKKCTQNCPMSVKVDEQVKTGEVSSLDCILCGICVDNCPKKVLKYGMRRK